jgi:hypothetical protein
MNRTLRRWCIVLSTHSHCSTLFVNTFVTAIKLHVNLINQEKLTGEVLVSLMTRKLLSGKAALIGEFEEAAKPKILQIKL